MDSPTRNSISNTIQELSRKVFDNPSLTISDSMGPNDIPGWTSLTFTQLLTEIETTFNFKFKIFEIIKMQTIGGIVDVTTQHVSQQ